MFCPVADITCGCSGGSDYRSCYHDAFQGKAYDYEKPKMSIDLPWPKEVSINDCVHGFTVQTYVPTFDDITTNLVCIFSK